MDRFPRWPTATPLTDTSAPTISKTGLRGWIAIFDRPQVITTDRGSQFQSSLLSGFTYLLGTKHIRTTVYHPCANGLMERFQRSLKTSLSTRHDATHWIDDIPFILLSLRNSLKDLACSAAELVFGTPLSLPGQYFSSTAALTPTSTFIYELRHD